MAMTFSDFISTRKEMSAHEFGQLIEDLAWEGEKETRFLVYLNQYWIEKLPDGYYYLQLENADWISANLTKLEIRLWFFACFDFSTIDSPESAREHLANLVSMGLDYHPEDSVETIIFGLPIPSDIIEMMEAMRQEVWQHLDDPCGELLKIKGNQWQ